MQNAFVLPTNLALAKRTEGEPDRRTEAAIAAAAAHAGSVFGLFLLRAASLGALWLAFSLVYHLSLSLLPLPRARNALHLRCTKCELCPLGRPTIYAVAGIL